MKYEAHDHDDAIVGGWDIKRDGTCPRRTHASQWSEAEARIAAWALNRTYQGYRLVAVTPAELGALQARGAANMTYDGPTE